MNSDRVCLIFGLCRFAPCPGSIGFYRAPLGDRCKPKSPKSLVMLIILPIHLTVLNQPVQGSSPCAPTINSKDLSTAKGLLDGDGTSQGNIWSNIEQSSRAMKSPPT